MVDFERILQVKAQGLLNAAEWIETEYGREALGEIVRACSPEVRETYISGIAINWHPVEELIEFVERADRMVGRGNGQFAEEIGAAGARANIKGTLVRAAVYLAQPEFLFRRVASIWRQFNDEGAMLVHSLDAHTSSLEVTGLKNPNATFCGVLTGWTRELAIALGAQKPIVRHSACRARGDARCVWQIRWAAIDEEASVSESANRLRASARFPSSGNLTAANTGSSRPSSQGKIASGPPGSVPSSGRPPSSGRVVSTSDSLAPLSGRPPSSGRVPSAGEPSAPPPPAFPPKRDGRK
jgi:hypothetical protein